jgi:nitrite reductase (NO-forming)
MNIERAEVVGGRVSRRNFLGAAGAGAMLLGVSGALAPRARGQSGGTVRTATVVADPTAIPAPIRRHHPVHHDLTLEAKEVRAKLADGTEFGFMTWNGQIPGPMIRVRVGDTVTLSVRSAAGNMRPHCVDVHAIYGSGGGAMATVVPPGGAASMFFKCLYPGAFIYHCAVPGMDEHISRGMFGMMLVEPPDGLPPVDREFYIGQHELYTCEPFGTAGLLHFDFAAMAREEPNFVLFNGMVQGLTPAGVGALRAKVGETVRVFMVNGGPNLSSSFHPIGNVWSRCWPQGALANPPLAYIQTQPVAPGSCFIGELHLPLAETVKLVDHALSRVERQGLLAQIDVEGAADPGLFHKTA